MQRSETNVAIILYMMSMGVCLDSSLQSLTQTLIGGQDAYQQRSHLLRLQHIVTFLVHEQQASEANQRGADCERGRAPPMASLHLSCVECDSCQVTQTAPLPAQVPNERNEPSETERESQCTVRLTLSLLARSQPPRKRRSFAVPSEGIIAGVFQT